MIEPESTERKSHDVLEMKVIPHRAPKTKRPAGLISDGRAASEVIGSPARDYNLNVRCTNRGELPRNYRKGRQ